jgi:murein L,D-transpeptidase YafK
LLASAAFAAAVALSGCDTDSTNPSISAKAMKPIPPKTLSAMAQKNMTKESPILIRLFKQESELEVWKEDSTGRMALLKTYPICRWSGDLGPKIREGDRQAPEGFYTITQANMNPASSYYLAVNMGFPNAYDKANDRTGNFLMIHGDCSSRGCYAMTDEQISEIYALARESFFGGQRAFQIQAYPFRMTPTNMAKHRGNPNMPFWRMLKEGYDHFEVTRLEPKVDVCEKRYVFNAAQPEGSSAPLNFSPRAQCPVYEVPSEIASAVAEKKKKDDTAVAELINRGTPAAPVKMATDGGMHEVFATALQGGRTVRGMDGDVQRVATTTPGTIPAHVNPPSNVSVASAPAAAAPAPAPAVTQPATPPRSNSIVARAPAQAAPRPAQAASAQPTQTAAASVPGVEATRNFLNSLFTSKGSQTQTASAAPSAPAQAAKSVDLRGTMTPARPAAAGAKPKPTAVAEAKPMPLPEPEETAAPGIANAGAIRPQSSPISAFNGPPANTSTGLLSGAAPVIPAGSFGGSWR